VLQDQPAAAPRTESITPVETHTPQPDRDLLSKLTRPTFGPQTEHGAPAKPSAVDVPESSDTGQVNKSVLDALTGKTAPPTTEKPRERPKDGEVGDE